MVFSYGQIDHLLHHRNHACMRQCYQMCYAVKTTHYIHTATIKICQNPEKKYELYLNILSASNTKKFLQKTVLVKT